MFHSSFYSIPLSYSSVSSPSRLTLNYLSFFHLFFSLTRFNVFDETFSKRDWSTMSQSMSSYDSWYTGSQNTIRITYSTSFNCVYTTTLNGESLYLCIHTNTCLCWYRGVISPKCSDIKLYRHINKNYPGEKSCQVSNV